MCYRWGKLQLNAHPRIPVHPHLGIVQRTRTRKVVGEAFEKRERTCCVARRWCRHTLSVLQKIGVHEEGNGCFKELIGSMSYCASQTWLRSERYKYVNANLQHSNTAEAIVVPWRIETNTADPARRDTVRDPESPKGIPLRSSDNKGTEVKVRGE